MNTMNEKLLLRNLVLGLILITSGCDSFTLDLDRSGSLDLDTSIKSEELKASGVRVKPIALSISYKGLCGDWLRSDFPERFQTAVLRNPKELSSSHCLHMVSAFGPGISIGTEGGAVEQLLDLLLNQERAIAVFGHPTLYESAYGIRPYARSEAGRGTQAHHDQLLCCLAQIGIGSNQICNVNGRNRRVEDLLVDSLADFYISKKELAFTAIAYAHMLPPRQSWKNKFDEETRFSDVVNELLSREIGSSHCFGTHLYEAMIVIHRIDREQHCILNFETRSRLEERIAQLTSTAISRQHTDGSWNSNWFESHSSELSSESDRLLAGPSKLLVTGHLIQMLAKLSYEFEIDEHVFRRGIGWLDLATTGVSDEELTKDFCPSSHAAWCLNHFSTHEESTSEASAEEGSL